MNKSLLHIITFLFLSFASHAQPLRSYSVVSLMNGSANFITDSNTVATLPVWGYGWNIGTGSTITLPGPTIYANQGDSVHFEMVNPSMEGHTIHLHGLDVDEANDGVPHHTGFILQGDSFTYRFKATHAGNFLYHCHVTTTMHLALGMYGMVIVYPTDSSNRIYDNGPTYDSQYEFLLSDLDARWNTDYTKIGSFLSYAPDMFLINGKNKSIWYADTNSNMQGAVGERLLMRLLNVGYRVNRVIFPSEVDAVVHTSDGRPLPQPFSTDTLILYPGERFSVLTEILDETPTYARIDWLDPYRLSYLGSEYIPINNPDFQFIPFEEDNSLLDSIALSNSSLDEKQVVKLFPNPVVDHFVISSDRSIAEINVYNYSGQFVTSQVGQSSNIQWVNADSWTPGIYFIEMLTDQGETFTIKLVKVPAN